MTGRFADFDEDRFVDRVGHTSLPELMSLIAGANLVVASDTGIVHMAFALGRPSVAVVGGGLPQRYHPYPADTLPAEEDQDARPAIVTSAMDCFGCGWHCTHPVVPNRPAPCIEQIAIEPVLDQILARLAITTRIGACHDTAA